MNRTYRLVWSRTRRTWIAAPEIARAHGKSKTLKVGAGATAVRGIACVATALALLGAAPLALAADLYWDGTDTTSGNGAPTGGSGTWDAATPNWTNDAAGTSNQAWVAGDGAIFGNTGGTVTLSGSQSVGDITFAVDGYQIQGGTGLNLAKTGSDTTLTVSNGAATISSAISGDSRVIKAGAGTLNLTGTNTYSTGTTLNDGTLVINNGGALGSGPLIINGGELHATNDLTISTSYLAVNGIVSAASGKTLTLSPATAAFVTGLDFQIGSAGNTGTVVFAPNNRFLTCLACRISVNYGTLKAGNSQLGQITGGYVTTTIASGAILDFNDFNASVRNLQGAGTLNTGSAATTDITLQSGDFSGTIQGAGEIIKSGASYQTLTLSGANTYTGGTTISGGTLALSGSGTLGAAGSGNLTVNGGTLDLGTTSQTKNTTITLTDGAINNGTLTSSGSFNVQKGSIGAILAGTAPLTKTGTDTVTLTGANTYSGGTTITGGTLALSGSGTLGAAGSGNLTVNGGTLDLGGTSQTKNTTITLTDGAINNGTLTSSGSFAVQKGSIGAILAGTAPLTKTGTDTVTLTGANTYSGGTTITGGTLALSGSGTLGAAGSGNLTVNGGTLDLGGTSQTKNTTITLTDGAINNGTLTSSGSFAVQKGSIGAILAGTAGLTKTGTDTVTLTGANTYTGATTIDGGALSVNGSITSATTVNTGGTLKGSGTVGSVTLSGGTLAPGNSIGTLNVSGNVDFSGGGTYQVEVDSAGNSDKIIASGTATLTGGSVQVVAAAGTYSYATDYTILTAGSVSGTFNSVSANLAFLTPTLSYDATHAYLKLTRNDVSYGGVANTPNQRAVGNALTAINTAGASGDMQTLLSTVNTLSGDSARQGYDSLSGVQHANAQSLMLGSGGQLAQLLGARTTLLAAHPGVVSPQASAFAPVQLAFNGDLSDLQLAMNGTPIGDGGDGSGLWLMPQGGFGAIEDTPNARGATYYDYGLYGGADRWLDNEHLAGWSLGYTRTEGSPSAGTLRLDSAELALYGRWLQGENYFDASVSAGYHQNNNSRQVTVGAITRTASSDYIARSATLTAEAGRTLLKSGTLQLTPFVGVSYARIERSAFGETGAGAADLQVAGSSQDSWRSSLGLRATDSRSTASGSAIETDFEAAWVHEFGDRAATLSAAFSGAPTTEFLVDGPALDRDRLRLGAGLTSRLGTATTLRVGYQGELAGSDSRHALSATFRMQW